MERAALDLSDRGDASGFLEISDPDVVYIDLGLDKPIYGLAALRDYYRRQFVPRDAADRGEMLNSKVQVAGDTAVLMAENWASPIKIARWLRQRQPASAERCFAAAEFRETGRQMARVFMGVLG